MNLKASAYKIKTQTNALNKLLEGMETVDWTDETPIGVMIFLKHIITEIDRLYNALPGKVYNPILPSGLTAAQYEQVSDLREKIPAPSGAGNNRKPGRAVRGAKQSKGRGHGKK